MSLHNVHSFEQVKRFVDGPETYTVQDQEDATHTVSGATWDEAMDLVYSMHGKYAVTNEHNGITSFYTYC